MTINENKQPNRRNGKKKIPRVHFGGDSLNSAKIQRAAEQEKCYEIRQQTAIRGKTKRV